MKIAFALFSLVGFSHLVFAESLANQYAKTIVSPHLQVREPDLDLSEWQQSISGGYILRFTFDADGDGMVDRFFASTMNSDKLNCEWTVYSGFNDSPFIKTINLRPFGFWWNPASRESLNYFRLGAEGGVAIFSKIEDGKIVSREEQVTLDEIKVGFEHKAAPREGFQSIKPDVTISLLADVVADADSGWRPLILDDAGNNYSLPNGRLLLTEDAPRVESLRSFTPKAAFAALQKSEPQSEKSSNKPPTTSTLPIVKPSPMPKALETMPSTPREEPTSSTPWSVIAVLIVAAIGLLWLLVKKRK